MKKLTALLLMICLLLSGCGSNAPAETTAVPTTEAITEPTTEPTTAPTEPEVFFNPLNGEILDEPFTDRIIAHTITNTQDAIPHVGVNECDIYFEAYVSTGVVRSLALFTDISDVEAIGGCRSTRLLFNQICHNYDAVMIHGGGFTQVLQDANGRGLDHFNVDSLYRQGDPLAQKVAYRDKVYKRQAPNNLFGYGPGIMDYLEAQNVRLTQSADKDYSLTFVDDATPVNGQDAGQIQITFGQNTKTTTMIYDPDTEKYVYYQYGKVMRDQITDEVESFKNVVILQADVYANYIYQEANFQVGGTGYYACNGKMIPITWECNDAPAPSPFHFMTETGAHLDFNRGNTYIAIVGFWNPLEFTAETNIHTVLPPETEPVETTEATVPETTAQTIPETTAETTQAA